MSKTKAKQNSWMVLIAIGMGVLMAMLDVTIVNVALPTIQREFHTSYVNTQWVVNAYTSTYAISILLISKLGDMYGKKLFFILSMVVFTAGSLLCSIAPSSLILNISRGIEGIGGAGILGLSMALIGDNYEGKQRAFILGIWGSIVGFGTSVGPLVGGVLVQFFNWRSIFLINIPIGIIAILIGIKFITEKHHDVDHHIDILGMILSTAMVFCLVYGLLNKENNINASWFTPNIMGWLVSGIILLLIFILWEKHTAHPMMNLVLFKKSSFVGSCVAAFTITLGLFSFFTYLTILLQDYMGYTPLEVGLQRLLISIFPLFLGAFVGYLVGKIGSKIVTTGSLFLEAVGVLTMNLMLGYHLNWEFLIPAFIFMGLGNAGINPAISNAALLDIEPENMGMASGINSVFRQFGNCLGIVIQGLIVGDGYRRSLLQNLGNNHLSQQIIKAGPFSGMEIASKLHPIPHITTTIQHAYYDGIHELLWLSLILFIVAGIICWLLIKNPVSKDVNN